MARLRRLTLADRLAALAGLVAMVASVAGYLPGFYRDNDTLIVQSHGQDIATLLFALPLLIVGLLATGKGSIRGRLLVMGVNGYLLYTYAVFAFVSVLGPETPFQIAVVGLSSWAFLVTLVSPGNLVRDSESTIGLHIPRRATAAYMFVVAALFALAWLSQIGGAIATGVRPQALVDAGWPTNPVYTLDLALALPLVALTGWLVASRRPGGSVLAVPLLVFIPLLSIGILTMGVVASLDGQPLEAAMSTIFFIVAALGGALGLRSLAPLRLVEELRSGGARGDESREQVA